jgi:hypothetical protein
MFYTNILLKKLYQVEKKCIGITKTSIKKFINS